jgi:translation elongation factor EF-1beta
MENKLLILEAFSFTLDSLKYAEAERNYQESLSGATEDPEMRAENELLKKKLENLENQVKSLTERISKLEASGKTGTTTTTAPATTTAVKTAAPVKAAGDSKAEDDDDVDLFGSDDEEDVAAKAAKDKLLADYAAKKSKKPAVIAKSNVILDVKPWDDETDMKELEKAVRTIQMDGLLWGTSKLVPVGYGINKLQIATVVEDEKVSIDELQEKIEAFEDYVQSVDIAAFNKI